MTAEDKIRLYVLENYMFTNDQSELSNDDSFLEKGILDSTGILEIINLLEDSFGITVEDDEMIPENLDSISNILRFIERKK